LAAPNAPLLEPSLPVELPLAPAAELALMAELQVRMAELPLALVAELPLVLVAELPLALVAELPLALVAELPLALVAELPLALAD